MNGFLCVVEAFGEEEFAKIGERGEEKRVESGVKGTRWDRGLIGDVTEGEFYDV